MSSNLGTSEQLSLQQSIMDDVSKECGVERSKVYLTSTLNEFGIDGDDAEEFLSMFAKKYNGRILHHCAAILW